MCISTLLGGFKISATWDEKTFDAEVNYHQMEPINGIAIETAGIYSIDISNKIFQDGEYAFQILERNNGKGWVYGATRESTIYSPPKIVVTIPASNTLLWTSLIVGMIAVSGGVIYWKRNQRMKFTKNLDTQFDDWEEKSELKYEKKLD